MSFLVLWGICFLFYCAVLCCFEKYFFWLDFLTVDKLSRGYNMPKQNQIVLLKQRVLMTRKRNKRKKVNLYLA